MHALPLDLSRHIIFRFLTIYELAYVARVCKLWNSIQQSGPLHEYKTSLLLRDPACEKQLIGSYKARCIEKLFQDQPSLNMRKVSSRIYIGMNSLTLPYLGRLYVMTLDPLFISSQERNHGLVKENKNIYFYCFVPKSMTMRRILRPFQMSLSIYKKEEAPKDTIQTQLEAIGAFPIAEESVKGWNNATLTYYLLPFTTPYLFLVKGLDLIAIYSIPTSQKPLSYQKSQTEDIYDFEKETWKISLENRAVRIKVTLKNS